MGCSAFSTTPLFSFSHSRFLELKSSLLLWLKVASSTNIFSPVGFDCLYSRFIGPKTHYCISNVLFSPLNLPQWLGVIRNSFCIHWCTMQYHLKELWGICCDCRTKKWANCYGHLNQDTCCLLCPNLAHFSQYSFCILIFRILNRKGYWLACHPVS